MTPKKQDTLKVPNEQVPEVTVPITSGLSGASLAVSYNANANSDSEIGIERRYTVAKKNRSSLFLMKSHSFIDRPSALRSVVVKERPSDLIERVNVSALLLAQNERDNLKCKAKSQKSKTKSKAFNQTQFALDPTDDDLNNVLHLLRRKPSIILEQEVSAPSPTRKISAPSPPTGVKRDSFLRQSLQSIRRSFTSNKKYVGSSAASSSSSSSSSNSGEVRPNGDAMAEVNSETIGIADNQLAPQEIGKKEGSHVKFNLENKENIAESDLKSSDFNVCSFADTYPNSFMAPLLVDGSGHTETQSASCLDTIDKNSSPTSEQQQQQQKQQQPHKRHYSHQTSLPGGSGTGSGEYSSANSSDSKSHKHSSSTSLNPLVAANSLASIRSISPSRKSFNFNGSTTAKNEQSSSTAAATTAAATPTEKEKKRKEVSSSRVKKFQRHFAQVSKDEKLINYFSCALVSDILLQGHLYITDKHFAFYSNVFGYVTKVVIPTSSVTKISKEKTAKIIPNAVGVATADERHVFGSFISREAAFRLMCSVCPPLAPTSIELLSKIPADILEYSEELSIEDDSSCSISGNESPPQAAGADGQTLLRRNIAGSSLNIGGSEKKEKLMRHSDIPKNAKSSSSTSLAQHQGVSVRASAPPISHYNTNNNNSNSRNSNINIGSGSSHITNNSSNINNNNTKSSSSSSSSANINKNTTNTNSITMSSLTSLLTTPTTGAAASSATNLTMIIAGTASSTSNSSTPSPSSVSSTTSMPTTVLNTPPKPAKTAVQVAATSFKALSKNALLRLKFPKELHVVYLGVMLSIILALFTGFLLYRISNIEAKISLYRSPVVNYGSVNDDDIFADALRWQKELQTKSTEEAQNILNTNLQQIAKVRRSLETLSMLIHDRSSAANLATNAAEAFDRDDSD